jgi:hypothetical protein
MCPGLRSRAGSTTAANAGRSKVARHARFPSAWCAPVTLEVPPAAEARKGHVFCTRRAWSPHRHRHPLLLERGRKHDFRQALLPRGWIREATAWT